MRDRTTLLLALALAACGDPGVPGTFDPSADPVDSHVDPGAQDIDPDAPFEPGQRRDVGDAAAVFHPGVHNEYVSGVVMPGDLDGDGFGDVVFWTYRYNPPDTVPCDDGCPSFTQLVAYIDYGGPEIGIEGRIVPDATILGWHINTLRHWIAPAGDLDGDGRDDLLVSVGGLCEQGNVLTLWGGPRLNGVVDVRDVASLMREQGSCTGFGTAVGVGDLDGDGRGDLVVAAPDSGAAYLYYGRAERPTGRLSEADADAVLRGLDGARLGPAQPAGDLDGDGLDDLLVSSAPSEDTIAETVRWWILPGGARLRGEVTLSDATSLDAALAHGVGDLDGDGRDELGVTRLPDQPTGFVIPGGSGWPDMFRAEQGSLTLRREPSDAEAHARPSALLPAGDVNGDGADDFLYVDPTGAEGGGGAAHLFLGPVDVRAASLDLDQSIAFLGRTYANGGADELGAWSWHLGNSVAAGSDLDGDGYDDLVMVSRLGQYYGQFYVWRGRP